MAMSPNQLRAVIRQEFESRRQGGPLNSVYLLPMNLTASKLIGPDDLGNIVEEAERMAQEGLLVRALNEMSIPVYHFP